ncbi:hypothetical protein Gogos_000669 [Gossypium gossypioides]|uniref:Uncharacterized protein n=1 Tax=Gossypium gossypioides TaxID=34282 RepID=A0A7J9CTI6_GOSGO|nr:hypothetical protein [Gossypium gossypioides]
METFSLLPILPEDSSLPSIRRFWPEVSYRSPNHFRGSLLQVKAFSSSQGLRCNSMRIDVFLLWNENKLNLLKTTSMVLNISDYCSNDRFIYISALTFLDDVSDSPYDFCSCHVFPFIYELVSTEPYEPEATTEDPELFIIFFVKDPDMAAIFFIASTSRTLRIPNDPFDFEVDKRWDKVLRDPPYYHLNL